MTKLPLRLLALALFLSPAVGTSQSSQLQLEVVDMSGNRVGPVKVLITSPDGEVIETETRRNGRLRIGLRPAETPYRLLLQKAGFPDRETHIQLNAGRTTIAKIELLDEATNRKQQAVDAFNSGIHVARTGDSQGALSLFQRAAELDPTIANAHWMVASGLADQERFEEAAVALDNYLEMEDMNVEVAPLALAIFEATGDPRAQEAARIVERVRVEAARSGLGGTGSDVVEFVLQPGRHIAEVRVSGNNDSIGADNFMVNCDGLDDFDALVANEVVEDWSGRSVVQVRSTTVLCEVTAAPNAEWWIRFTPR